MRRINSTERTKSHRCSICLSICHPLHATVSGLTLQTGNSTWLPFSQQVPQHCKTSWGKKEKKKKNKKKARVSLTRQRSKQNQELRTWTNSCQEPDQLHHTQVLALKHVICLHPHNCWDGKCVLNVTHSERHGVVRPHEWGRHKSEDGRWMRGRLGQRSELLQRRWMEVLRALIINLALLAGLHPGPCETRLYYSDSLPRTSCCCCSVAKLCPTLCGLMDCSMPGSSVLHYLPGFVQTHVFWVSDTIEPISSNESALSIRWPKNWGLQLQSFQWIFRVDFL